MARPLEHLVLFSVVVADSQESEEDNLIIQLAWEIISISKNQVLVKDQVYVCPAPGSQNSVLGHLPPGVNPEAIQSAGNLDSALKQFHATLTKLGGSTFSLMTFGPSALRGFLHPQAYKICMTLQKYLCRYLDLVKEFSKAWPSLSVPASIVEMANSVGIPAEGVPRSGVEELAVAAQVAQKLISQGHLFQSQEFIRDDIKLDTTPDPNLVKEGCVVRLRGLPFQASLKDVAGFLSGLNPIPGGIVFGINPVGRRTGEAIAVLENVEQATLALQRNKHYMNQRYIEVTKSSPEEFNKWTGIQDSMGGGGGGGTGGGGHGGVFIARLQGLPYRVTEEEIVDFFSSCAKVKNGADGVLIMHYADGKATGDGFALFGNEEEFTKALQLNKSMIGNRYVELFDCPQKEFEMVLSRSNSSEVQRRFGDMLGLEITPELEGLSGSSRDCVKLRGIPFTSTAEDVIVFFGDMKEEIALQGVHMVLNSMNRPTGECYVQMKSVDAARKASDTLHKNYMERRYIEVFQCSGDEVRRGLQEGTGGGGGRGTYRDTGYRGRGGGGGGGGGGRYYDDDRDRRRRPSGGSSVKVRGLPFSTREDELCNFFADYDVREHEVEIIYNRQNRPSGIAYVTFPNRDVAQQAIREKNGKHIGSRYLELSLAH